MVHRIMLGNKAMLLVKQIQSALILRKICHGEYFDAPAGTVGDYFESFQGAAANTTALYDSA